jgi:hypothetical protein
VEDLHVEWKVKSFALAKLASEAYARAAFEYCIVTNCFIPINKDAISRAAGTNMQICNDIKFLNR